MSIDPLDLEAQICFPLHAASRAVTQAYGELLSESGLTYPQYLVMLVLWQAEQPLTVGELGERLRSDSGTLTPVLKRLEGSGRVARRRSTEDERKVLVSATPEGLRLREELKPVPQKLASLTGLGPDELEQLKGLLGRIMESIDVRS
ncbi:MULTISPECIES: MarR family winged helix-turn-helix transcriptional regulator [unclassified Leucobacter]|uniref:MarR family winged helix-turn-helix transcriptional regulator n=1 Tax=unclassified Leucobacter TaxID=2621730 RepID=UPI0030166775